MGKSRSVVAKAAMNASLYVWIARSAAVTWWLLYVWIAHSAAVTWWLCSSMSCSLHRFLVRNCLMYLVA